MSFWKKFVQKIAYNIHKYQYKLIIISKKKSRKEKKNNFKNKNGIFVKLAIFFVTFGNLLKDGFLLIVWFDLSVVLIKKQTYNVAA